MPSAVSKIPSDTTNISTSFASKLAISFVENTLYLKNQVPLPISQVGRLNNAKSDRRTVKQLNELLDSFDLLCSHLQTTFSALSTAVARCNHRPKSTPAYLVILIGPALSAASAKAKLVLALDSMEVKIWGERSDPTVDLDTGDLEPEDDSISDTAESDEEGSECSDVTDSSEEEDGEEGSDGSEADMEIHSSSSVPSSLSSPPLEKSAQTPQTLSVFGLSPEERTTRLLARTLGTVLNDGEGIGADIVPTQTHVLLLAPRRFQHPAWIPRQQFGSGNTYGRGVLDDFWTSLNATEEEKAEKITQRPRRAHKLKTEGICVQDVLSSGLLCPHPAGEVVEEEDEMLWWSWEGKLSGFSI